MIKRECSGYVDADDVKHPCGVSLGTKPGGDGVSHGLCPSCEVKAHDALLPKTPHRLFLMDEAAQHVKSPEQV